MDVLIDFINQNVMYAPFIIFGLLLLAGFNLPVSEDLMIFTSALLAIKNPQYTTQLIVGLMLGAYLSDIICYAVMGRYFGTKIRKYKMFKKMVTDEQIDKVSDYYHKYGMLTLIIGRFIPFGVRNALFFTAGLSKMNAFKFCIGDLIATLLSSGTYFYLYYTYGESAVDFIKKSNYFIFAFFLAIILGFAVKKWRKNRLIKYENFNIIFVIFI
jgi:membrane protein DedA with SNARE-associated domain